MIRARVDLSQRDQQAFIVRFAKKLRARMDAQDLSADELAARLAHVGVKATTASVNKWLRAQSLPRLQDLEALGDVLQYADYRSLLPPPL